MLTPESRVPNAAASSLASLTPSERLVLTVARACRQAGRPTSELRDAVSAHVRELKQRGYPPERVLIAVKGLIAEAGIKNAGPLADRGSSTGSPETKIIEQVVSWCIGDYFVPADDPGQAGAVDNDGTSGAERKPSLYEPESAIWSRTGVL